MMVRYVSNGSYRLSIGLMAHKGLTRIVWWSMTVIYPSWWLVNLPGHRKGLAPIASSHNLVGGLAVPEYDIMVMVKPVNCRGKTTETKICIANMSFFSLCIPRFLTVSWFKTKLAWDGLRDPSLIDTSRQCLRCILSFCVAKNTFPHVSHKCSPRFTKTGMQHCYGNFVSILAQHQLVHWLGPSSPTCPGAPCLLTSIEHQWSLWMPSVRYLPAYQRWANSSNPESNQISMLLWSNVGASGGNKPNPKDQNEKPSAEQKLHDQ